MIPAAVLVKPTAHALFAPVAVTAVMAPLVPGLRLGLVTTDQAVPFHRSKRGALPVSMPVEPTAHALVADVAVTELSLASVPGLGLPTIVQAVPSQCWVNVVVSVPDPKTVVCVNPTAHALVADVAETDWRTAPFPWFGLGTTVHEVPSQCSMSGPEPEAP
jgi:hypothetical protein